MSQELERNTAIAESILHTAKAVAEMSKIAFPKKRIFPAYDRKPGKTKKKLAAKIQVPIIAVMGAVNLAMIMSQPIRKPESEIELNVTL